MPLRKKSNVHCSGLASFCRLDINFSFCSDVWLDVCWMESKVSHAERSLSPLKSPPDSSSLWQCTCICGPLTSSWSLKLSVFFPLTPPFCGQRSAGDIMIRNIQPKHAGKYTCAVQTKVDSVSIATDVVVRGKHVSVFFWVGLLFCCFCAAQISNVWKRSALTVSRLDDVTCVLAAERSDNLVTNAKQSAARAESGTW